jgi:hypothetical protein
MAQSARGGDDAVTTSLYHYQRNPQPATKEHNMHRTSKLKDIFYTICAILAVFILFGIVGAMDVQEEERQHAEYCEMVRLWKQTGGQAGWPAYDGEGACR